jgi:hypothetical protein
VNVRDKSRIEALQRQRQRQRQRQLTEQVEGIQSGKDWGQMLAFAARFRGQPATVVQTTAQRVIRAAHDVLTALDAAQLGHGAPPGLAAALALRADYSPSRDIAIEAGVPDFAIGG